MDYSDQELNVVILTFDIFCRSRSRSFNEVEFGTQGRRRTRSVSPTVADSAMTIVQSALNKRQLQVLPLAKLCCDDSKVII